MPGRVFQPDSCCPCSSPVILMVLLGSTLVGRLAGSLDAGSVPLTSNVSGFVPELAFVRALYSLILITFVRVDRGSDPGSPRRATCRYARDTRLNRCRSPTSATSPPCLRSCTASSDWWSFCRRRVRSPGPQFRRELHLRRDDPHGAGVADDHPITMEAFRAVPKGMREGAYGVGATRWESCGVTSCRTRRRASSPARSCAREGFRGDGSLLLVGAIPAT